MENSLNLFGKKLPPPEVTYFSQIILIFFLIVTSVVNLSLHTAPRELWITLLASSVAVLLPAPILPIAAKKNNETT